MSRELLNGILIGLLIGAGVFGHVWRFVSLQHEDEKNKGRELVALVAIVLYTAAAAFVLAGFMVGHWIAIIGPACGITAVFLLPGSRIDALQIVLGVPQIMASFLAFVLLVERVFR